MAFLGTFWKIFTKKLRFFGALSLKISIYWRRRLFRKILGSVSQKWISQYNIKRGQFGSAEGQIPEGGIHTPRFPSPLNPPVEEA